jgi:hypothetical protein
MYSICSYILKENPTLYQINPINPIKDKIKSQGIGKEMNKEMTKEMNKDQNKDTKDNVRQTQTKTLINYFRISNNSIIKKHH